MILVVLVPIVLAAILYIMVSGLISAPTQQPIVIFGPVDQTGGNATILVASSSGEIVPSGLEILLRANYSGSVPVGMPPPDGSVGISTGGYLFQVFWLDRDHDQTVGVRDAFVITGSLAPLPASTGFTFSLRSSNGAGVSEVSWTTP